MAAKGKTTPGFLKTLFLLLTGIIGLQFVGSFFPGERLWGINHAAFVPGWIFIYPLLFLAALVTYWMGNAGAGRSPKKSSGKSGPAVSRILPFFLIPVMAGVYYFLSVRAHFLGDGYQLISSLSAASPNMIGRAYGERVIQLLYHNLIWSGGKFDAYTTFRNLSIFAGVIYTLALVFYGRKLTSNGKSFAIFIVLNSLAAATILFYGYVETYSLATAFTYLAMLSAMSSLKNDKKSIVPILAFALAVYLHWISVVYLPALLLYLSFIFGPAGLKTYLMTRRKFIPMIILGGFILSYIAVKIWAPPFWRLALLPPLSNPLTLDGYTLLSPQHLLDIANLIVMLAPVTVLIMVLKYIRKKDMAESEGRLPEIFLTAAALSGLLAAFLLDPKLGMARDWDLMSTMLIPLQLIGVYYWVENDSGPVQFRFSSILLVIVSLSVFIPWLALNNSGLGLFNYTTSMMKLDPKHGRAGFFAFRNIMRDLGHKKEAVMLERYCSDEFPEFASDREGARYYKEGKVTKAIESFNRAIRQDPGWYAPYSDKATCLIDLGRGDEALELLKTADALNPYSAEIYYLTAKAYHILKDNVRARQFLARSITISPAGAKYYLALGKLFYEQRQLDSALYYFSRFPDSAYAPEVLYYKSMISADSGDTAGAINYIQKYLTLSHDSLMVQQAEKMMLNWRTGQ